MLFRKSTFKTNRMYRFENHVLLNFAFTREYIQASYPGKDKSFRDILFDGPIYEYL